jgi:hypothetical protein
MLILISDLVRKATLLVVVGPTTTNNATTATLQR